MLYRRADTPAKLQQSFNLFIVVKLSVDVDNDVIRLALWTKTLINSTRHRKEMVEYYVVFLKTDI